MIEATHTGRLKSLGIILDDLRERQIGADWLRRLMEFTGEEVNLIRKEDGKYSVIKSDFTALSVRETMLTDLKPIKPNMEIPKGDFWIEKGTKYLLRPDGYGNFTMESINGGYMTPKPKREEVQELLNNGIWIIVPEPKVETRPYTDEELKTYLMNGRWVKFKNISNAVEYYKPWRIKERSCQFADAIDGKYTWGFNSIIKHFRDEDGNKFKKEVK